jgi:hypothetical protein
VNDAEDEKANAVMKRVVLKETPHLALFATKDIQPDDEITYDYGDDAKNLWWRKQVKISVCGLMCVFCSLHLLACNLKMGRYYCVC